MMSSFGCRSARPAPRLPPRAPTLLQKLLAKDIRYKALQLLYMPRGCPSLHAQPAGSCCSRDPIIILCNLMHDAAVQVRT